MEAGDLNQAWAVRLPLASAAALGPLRTTVGLDVYVADDAIWLRGEAHDTLLRKRLLSLPAIDRYWTDAAGVLTPWGRITPAGNLPSGDWSPLRTWGGLALPELGWPASRPSKISLTLRRDTAERPCGALYTSWRSWADYVEAAPRVRFEGLAFALSSAGQVIIRGGTIPPLPGMPLVDQQGILVPAGWFWTPAVDSSTVREVLGLSDQECVFWPTSEHWQRIAAEAWVKTSRSAVRTTAREVGDV